MYNRKEHFMVMCLCFFISVLYLLMVLMVLCVDDLLTMKACPPSEEEFLDIFQKIKYSLSLVVSLNYS